MRGLRLAARRRGDGAAQRLCRLLRLVRQGRQAAVQLLPVPLRLRRRLARLRRGALRSLQGSQLGLRRRHRVLGRGAQLLEVGGGARRGAASAVPAGLLRVGGPAIAALLLPR